MANNLDNILNGAYGAPGCQSPQYPVAQVMQANPLPCPQSCATPVEMAGRQFATTLSEQCVIEFGPFTNTTSTTRYIVLGGPGLWDDRNIDAAINAGIIPLGDSSDDFFNGDDVTDEAVAQLVVAEKVFHAVPYVVSALTISIDGTDTVINTQFRQNLTQVHLEADIFDTCKATIKAPLCGPCITDVNNVQLFNTCPFYQGPLDFIQYPVVAGATVTIEECICAIADLRAYRDCAAFGTPGYVATAPALGR